ncbi:unnamed protein product [Echinostoma caproni]|uniref:Uncharacterized protein n=1 Tax=Echinostoma caproni TaxID=27848 RepID=A0A183B2B0_9TREM|nr:unnamed protein product [Echinostoma caproni]
MAGGSVGVFRGCSVISSRNVDIARCLTEALDVENEVTSSVYFTKQSTADYVGIRDTTTNGSEEDVEPKTDAETDENRGENDTELGDATDTVGSRDRRMNSRYSTEKSGGTEERSEDPVSIGTEGNAGQ